MNGTMAALVLLATASLGVLAEPVQAAEPEVRRPIDTQTVTVKARDPADLLAMINQTHVEMAAKGYQFVGMMPYSDHGNLAGVFLTYTRQ